MTLQTKLVATPFAPLPRGFERRNDGIWRKDKSKNGNAQWIWLCSDLRVLALPRDQTGKGWGRLIELIDPDGNTHIWSIPARLLASDGKEVISGLLDLGLNLATGRPASAAVLQLLSEWQPQARALTADRLGWTDESCSAFICGDGRVLGAKNVVYQNDAALSAASEMKTAGELEDWRSAVAGPCQGNHLMVFAVSLAFAGPLIEPLGLEGGGVHLRGASSRGKSTIQRAAVSVWGSPRFLHSWRATSNGLEGVATACNASILALDELGEISGTEAGAAVYMLANGVGKSRANRHGGMRPQVRWRVMVLSSGEVTLSDKVAEGGARAAAGQDIRLLDILADDRQYGVFDQLHGERDGAAFSDRLRQATSTQYGSAGPAFVEHFLAAPKEALCNVRQSIADFQEMAMQRFNLPNEGQVQRAVARLGLIAAAGDLATRYQLTGWAEDQARTAALEVLRIWLNGRGGTTPAEARAAINRVRAYLSEYGQTRFESMDRGGPAF